MTRSSCVEDLVEKVRHYASDIDLYLGGIYSPSENIRLKLAALCRWPVPVGDGTTESLIYTMKVFDFVHGAYTLHMSDQTLLKETLNVVYKIQHAVLEYFTQTYSLMCFQSGTDVLLELTLLLLSVAAAGDKLDVRFSLPVWKLFSNLIKRFKNDLKHHCDEMQGVDFLGKVMSIILDSSSFYYDCCLQSLKRGDTEKSALWDTSWKMLNLLCRIATFCVGEFLASSVTSCPSQSCTALSNWLAWIISIRYAGGYFRSGAGLQAELVRHLETSLFLSLDVLLGQLITLPEATSLDMSCCISAVYLKSATLTSVQKVRVLGVALAQLPKHSHCYSRWVCNDFNIYDAFLDACKQLFVEIEGQSELSTQEELVSSAADHFYTELLHQLCASLCGLPANCFYYLEQSIFSGLLCDHVWTSMLCADVWCFLARYGSGDLCWQYATLFASAIQLTMARFSSVPDLNERSTLLRVWTRLNRLGRLLARFLIFLTPKQQVQFLNQYPLSQVTPNDLSDLDSSLNYSLFWRFVLLPVQRLQKAARALAEDQLTARLNKLVQRTELVPTERESNVQLALDVAFTLRLVDMCSECWRRENTSLLVKLCSYFLMLPSDLIKTSAVQCPPHLLDSIRRPLCFVSGRILNWTTVYESDTKAKSQCSVDLLQWLACCCMICPAPKASVSPFRSFVTLRAWHFWLHNLEACSSVDNKLWLRKLASHLNYVAQEDVSIFCRPLLDGLKRTLTKWIPDSPLGTAVDTAVSIEEESLSQRIEQFNETFTQLESALSSNAQLSAADTTLLRNVFSRFAQLVHNFLPSSCG